VSCVDVVVVHLEGLLSHLACASAAPRHVDLSFVLGDSQPRSAAAGSGVCDEHLYRFVVAVIRPPCAAWRWHPAQGNASAAERCCLYPDLCRSSQHPSAAAPCAGWWAVHFGAVRGSQTGVRLICQLLPKLSADLRGLRRRAAVSAVDLSVVDNRIVRSCTGLRSVVFVTVAAPAG